MKQLANYENARIITGESTLLPAGGYIVKILDCIEVAINSKGIDYDCLQFSFDVAEGEYKNHFKTVWENSTDQNKKWKGIFNVFIPQEDSQYYESNLNRFKTMIVNFEESNPGFNWTWDEKDLKNKIIGLIYREKEIPTERGEIITITEPCGFRSVDAIKNNNFKIPQKKLFKKDNTAINDLSFTEMTDLEGDLPF